MAAPFDDVPAQGSRTGLSIFDILESGADIKSKIA